MTALETVHAIELRHITKRFGKVVANDDIDLALAVSYTHLRAHET